MFWPFSDPKSSMDETLIAAKFEGHIPSGFEPTFKFPFKGTEI